MCQPSTSLQLLKSFSYAPIQFSVSKRPLIRAAKRHKAAQGSFKSPCHTLQKYLLCTGKHAFSEDGSHSASIPILSESSHTALPSPSVRSLLSNFAALTSIIASQVTLYILATSRRRFVPYNVGNNFCLCPPRIASVSIAFSSYAVQASRGAGLITGPSTQLVVSCFSRSTQYFVNFIITFTTIAFFPLLKLPQTTSHRPPEVRNALECVHFPQLQHIVVAVPPCFNAHLSVLLSSLLRLAIKSYSSSEKNPFRAIHFQSPTTSLNLCFTRLHRNMSLAASYAHSFRLLVVFMDSYHFLIASFFKTYRRRGRKVTTFRNRHFPASSAAYTDSYLTTASYSNAELSLFLRTHTSFSLQSAALSYSGVSSSKACNPNQSTAELSPTLQISATDCTKPVQSHRKVSQNFHVPPAFSHFSRLSLLARSALFPHAGRFSDAFNENFFLVYLLTHAHQIDLRPVRAKS